MNPEADVALLRRFEPVLRFTAGERFFPMDVDSYVRSCSLWARRPDGDARCLVPQGDLTLEHLGRPLSADFGTVHYLKLTDPLGPAELAAYVLSERLHPGGPQAVFRPALGRLARVGYFSRLVDAIFAIGLLARGRVPGDAAAAASMVYRRLAGANGGHRYCGRVVRQGNWVVLQYWFFYLYNNWRSGFFGANDHEADWEPVCVYLSTSTDGAVTPRWVAYASHDRAGADLRRRWDDPELERVGDHPVVYVGAGSHASYFRPGEYLTELELSFLAPYTRTVRKLRTLWREKVLRYVDSETPTPDDGSFDVRVPFVDYARGDGLAVGVGQERCWEAPRLISEPPAWVRVYRGLWGLYAHDPFAGEDAPAGPMYNRDGTIRDLWRDPVSWAELGSVPPSPSEAIAMIRQRQEDLRDRQLWLEAALEDRSRRLQALGVELAAIRGTPHLGRLHETLHRQVQVVSDEIDELRKELAADRDLLDSLESHARNLELGKREPPRAHLRHPIAPTSAAELRSSRLAEVWAAVSVGVGLISLVGVAFFAQELVVHWLVVVVSAFVAIEALFRRWLMDLLSSVTTALALVAALVILYEFSWQIALLITLAAGLYLLWDNLRELWA